VDSALKLLRSGHISRAVQRLDNNGLGDMSDARIIDQLRDKHPTHKEDIEDPESAQAYPRISIKLRDTLRRLDDQAGTGISGFRNSYLSALTQDFADVRASQAVDLLDCFAEEYANAGLPRWFYVAFSAIRLVAPVKEAPIDPSGVPDVRPLGLGECLRRAIHTTVARDQRDVFEHYFWPQQVAVGVPGGLSLLILGIRTLLETRPDFAAVKIDFRNAYNEVCRAAVLRALEGSASLRGLAPLFRATHAHPVPIHLSAPGMPMADFRSEEGVHQGDALASAAFCAAIHDAVCRLDAELTECGGAARFDMDDGYAVGPPREVFRAVARFAEEVRGLGLELRVDKSKCFSFGVDLSDHQDRPASMPLGTAITTDGRVGYGIMIGGVPVGDNTFVHTVLDGKVHNAMSKANKLVNKLRDVHLPSLWTTLYYAIQPLFHYWLQHCYPTDCVEHAGQLDELHAAVASTCIPGLNVDDDITLRRLRLPSRMYGGGIRSLVDVAPAAFCATVCRDAPRMIDSVTRLGEMRRGFLPALTPLLGAGSFDDDEVAVWLAPLVSSHCRLGDAFAAAWRQLQAEVGEQPRGYLLGCPVAEAGRTCSRVQGALTAIRERNRFQRLDVDVRALPHGDVRRAAWLNLDCFGTV